MRYMTVISVAFIATQAQGYPCVFETECFEDESCISADFRVEVDIADQAIMTEFGDLVIVAVKETGRLTTMFATGEGSEYMLSLTPRGARMTSHANDGPQVISYLGRCEGAF